MAWVIGSDCNSFLEDLGNGLGDGGNAKVIVKHTYIYIYIYL